MRRTAAVVLLAMLAACVRFSPPKADPEPPPDDQPAPVDYTGGDRQPPIYAILFTHIEDNTPLGGTEAETEAQYDLLRGRLLDMAALAKRQGVIWVLQPDWRFLEAALVYEDASRTGSTGDVNVFKYMRDTLGAVIDPHSHENGGYNYADVAYLLEQLGGRVTGVVGGHNWDPSQPNYQDWERFRSPLRGMRYDYSWTAGILMGAKNIDISGVWRPADKDNFTTHNPAETLASVGSYKGQVSDVAELEALYAAGTVAKSCILTTAIHITPTDLRDIAAVEAAVVRPIKSYVDSARAVSTDFTSVHTTWTTSFGSVGCPYIGPAR